MIRQPKGAGSFFSIYVAREISYLDLAITGFFLPMVNA